MNLSIYKEGCASTLRKSALFSYLSQQISKRSDASMSGMGS